MYTALITILELISINVKGFSQQLPTKNKVFFEKFCRLTIKTNSMNFRLKSFI